MEKSRGLSNRCTEILQKMKINMPDASISEDIMSELWMKVSGAGPSSLRAPPQERVGKVAETNMGHSVVSGVYQENGRQKPRDIRRLPT